MTNDYRDHDHTAEDAFLAYVADPTPGNEHAAELAIATLQRRFDHVLRRLDGDGDPPPYPVHTHNPAETPEDCLDAVLFELAGAKMDDRAATLAHGLEAAHALARQRDEARDPGEDDFHFLHIDTDLNMADDDGNNWTILPLSRVVQERIAPGLRCSIGRSGSLTNAVIAKLKLLDESAA